MRIFEQFSSPGLRRRQYSLLASFALHIAVLIILLHGAPAGFVSLSEVGLGIPHSSGSLSIVYIAPSGPEQARPLPDRPRVSLRASTTRFPKAKPPETKPHESAAVTADHAADQTARGGSLFGRLPGSPLTGDEIVPAFPVVFPDPPVTRGDLPAGVQGDVIVEVTIDADGNVVQTKLVQGIGYGVEQKVLAILQQWRFHPAMRDGVTIASQHLVHFHYPS